jgi:hypothetical protein
VHDIARVMQPAWSRVLRVLCVAYIVATALHIAWIMAHEPFVFDAWYVAADTHARPFSGQHFFDYWWFEYTHSNPRIGQPLTYLAYKLEYFSVVATPFAYIGLALAAFVIGAGRLPKWRRGRDLALVSIAIGCMWFALPEIGKTLFNRAYGANYVYGAAIQLWFLVPLRLARDGQSTLGRALAYALFGVIAGMCNEHTGPTLALFAIAFAWWLHGRTQKRPVLAWAGALGFSIGFALIFFAPGQDERYAGLVQRVGLVGKLLQRGIPGNLEILGGLLLAAAPLLALVVTGVLFMTGDDETVRRRRALRMIGLALLLGVMITMTIFVSPKLGPRFYLLPMALLLAGFIALADTVLITPRRLAPYVLLAVAASGYAAAMTVPLYTRLAAASEARLDQLASSRRGSVVTVDAFEQIEDSWWFLGDDLRNLPNRQRIAKYLDLRDIVLRGYDPTAPLGVTDVRLVPHAEIEPARCLDEAGGFALGWYKGLDVSTIHLALRTAAEQVDERVRAAGGTLRRLDLTVQFVGARPALPRKTLLVGRWTPAGLESYVGAIRRQGRSTVREVVAPKPLADADLYIYQVGGEARQLDRALPRYVPWKTGVYWALACRADECWVLAVARQAQ